MASYKKQIQNFIKINIMPFLLQLLIKVIHFLNINKYHHPKDRDTNTPYIFAFWHGDLLMQPFNYNKYKKGIIKAIISDHRDGETITRIVSYLGIQSVRGSSTRGGAKALIGAIRTLKSGDDIAITPDGPQGPIYSVADGIVLLAQKTNTKIICLRSKPSKYWEFNSWDKFKLPKPFGTIHYYASEPFSIQSMQLDEAKKLIKSTLEKLGE